MGLKKNICKLIDGITKPANWLISKYFSGTCKKFYFFSQYFYRCKRLFQAVKDYPYESEVLYIAELAI